MKKVFDLPCQFIAHSHALVLGLLPPNVWELNTLKPVCTFVREDIFPEPPKTVQILAGSLCVI